MLRRTKLNVLLKKRRGLRKKSALREKLRLLLKSKGEEKPAKGLSLTLIMM